MRPRIRDDVEWKLNTFAKVQVNGVDVGKLPVSQKVQALIETYRQRDKPWQVEAREMEKSAGRHVKPDYRRHENFVMPESIRLSEREFRRTRVDDSIVEDLKEIHKEIEPVKAELDLSFNDRLNMVLERYNLYAKCMNVGWEGPTP